MATPVSDNKTTEKNENPNKDHQNVVENPSTTGGSPGDEQRAKDMVEDKRNLDANGNPIRQFGNDKEDKDESLLPAADNTAPSAIKARRDAGKDYLTQ